MVNKEGLVVNTREGVTVLDEDGGVVDELPFFYSVNGVDSNLAGAGVFHACTTNGLYSFMLEEGNLYYSNFHQGYGNCSSLTTTDFDNNGVKEVILEHEEDLIILNESGGELAREEIGEDFSYSINDLDGEGKAEIITITKNGLLTVYDTTYADNELNLTLSPSGFKITIKNKGFEPSMNANLTIRLRDELVSHSINLSREGVKQVLFPHSPSKAGNYTMNALVNDSKDYNQTNNNASLNFEVIKLSNSPGVLYNNTYYNFTSNHSRRLGLGDVNADGINEYLIDTGGGEEYDYFKDELEGYVKLGDLELEAFGFYDEFYTNQSLKLRTVVSNNAVYDVERVKLGVFVNNSIKKSRTFNITSNSTKGFNFTLSNFTIGLSNIRISLDYDNNVVEVDEENNIFKKSVRVYPVPIHELTASMDLTSTSLHNNYFNLVLNNSGDYNEGLFINCEPSICLTRNASVRNHSITELPVYLNVSMKHYALNFTLFNEDYFLSESLDIEFNCVYDSDCGDSQACVNNECVSESVMEEGGSVETLPSSEGVNESSELDNSIIDESRPVSSLIFLDSFNTDNPIIYWSVTLVLLTLASGSVYFLSLLFLQDHAQHIAITNFLLLLGVTYLFQPDNIHLILLEEFLISAIIIYFSRRFQR